MDAFESSLRVRTRSAIATEAEHFNRKFYLSFSL